MKDTDNGTRAQQQVQSEGHHNDGIDRRDFLGCMAWAGTGLLWTLAGGVPTAKLFAAPPTQRRLEQASACPDQRQPHRLQQAASLV